jgi:hypothetical protein
MVIGTSCGEKAMPFSQGFVLSHIQRRMLRIIDFNTLKALFDKLEHKIF